MPHFPPVVVLGLEDVWAGLTVVRELGEHGVPVHGIGRWRSGALYSRWLTRGYLAPASEAGLVELLNQIAQREGAPFLIAVAEQDIVFARRAADAGQLGRLRPLVPSLDKLELVNNKAATLRIAQEVGVPFPWTWHPQNADEIAYPPSELTFPCILKFPDKSKVKPLLARHGLVLAKTHYCYDKADLQRALAVYAHAGCIPLVQSYCRGSGLSYALFMHGGEAILRYSYRRLGDWPPEGGMSTVVESLPIDDSDALLAKSEALLKRIEWEGVAEVEYRHDPATGSAMFMEINGRFWRSQALAYYAGARFGWLTYAVLGLGKTVHPPPPRPGLVCVSATAETQRVLTLLFRPGRVQDRDLKFDRVAEVARYLSRLLDPRTRYYLFSWKDPIPSLSEMVLKTRHALGLLLKIAVRRLRAGTWQRSVPH